jgi:photosystem II stability/assembly factor-like uncharacterized protein
MNIPSSCPFNIPVISLPPQNVNGFGWGPQILPMNDPCVGSIAVDPTNDQAWYVGGLSGLYMTKDGGQSWTHPISGSVGTILLVPGSPELVYVSVESRLYLSRDEGKNWALLHTFEHPIRSVLVGIQHLFVGLGWATHAQPSGIFVSNLGGGLWDFHSFGQGQTGLIVWTLARDPQDGTLYAGTEIFDHPQPYHPPFFRSTNGGLTWTNVAGTLPWHVVAAAVRTDGYVYALTEGAGLFGSPDKGMTWKPPVNTVGPTVSLLMHPKKPTHLFGGRQKVGTLSGGAFLSANAGSSFQPIGLLGTTVAALSANGAGTRLYAVAYSSGVYVSAIPTSA